MHGNTTQEPQQDASTETTLAPERFSLDRRIADADAPACAAWFQRSELDEILYEIGRLTPQNRAALLQLLPPADTGYLLLNMPAALISEAIVVMAPVQAAALLADLKASPRADLLSRIPPSAAAAILEELPHDEASLARRLASYPRDSAGGLMGTEFLRYRSHQTVGEVIDDLSANADRYTDFDIQYAYVVDDLGRLEGVLRLRDLLLSPRRRELREIMIRSPLSVPDSLTLADLDALFHKHRFFGVPVIDERGRLCGVVKRTAVEGAVVTRAERTFLRSRGIIGGDELRSMPTLLRSRRRLAWLVVNIILNLIAVTVIAAHQDTLTAVIALAVFLPILADMSGCAGNQACAVTMRELNLGVLRPTEILRVMRAEIFVGLINGMALGAILAGITTIWYGNPWLGVVVGGALASSSAIAVCIGGVVPLVLKRLRIDPALAASPLLTTITNIIGFLLVMIYASLAMPLLT